MKVRKFKIKIESYDEFRTEIISTWRAIERRKPASSSYDLILSFPDLSWLSKVLSPERIRIIQTIRDKKPESLYQLAKLLGRSPGNVQIDVHELNKLGIIELKKIKKKGQKRESLQPEYNWDGFDIAV